MSFVTPEDLRVLLCALEDAIAAAVVSGAARDGLHDVAGATAADTIYEIDRLADEGIVAWLEAHWPVTEAVELVTEAFDEPVVIGRGTPAWTLILDPIDGTRGLMYDKRAAWALAAVAPHGGSLRDVVAAAMTEIPTRKQGAADQLSATRGGGVVGVRRSLADLRSSPLPIAVRPSEAPDLIHGWASFARFFPPGKALLARFEETLWTELYGPGAVADLAIFDDQYLATGGQFHELAVGHDRMLGDLRPLAFEALGMDSALACHPYDCCTALVVEEAGCVLTDPWGAPLDVPLDTTTPVAWVGFANRRLAELVRPAFDRAIETCFPEAFYSHR